MRRPFSSFSLPIFLLLSSTFHVAIQAKNLIPETCRTCAERDPNLSYNFCVTSLQAAAESHCAADLRELGKISIKLLKHNVTSTRQHIKKLLQKKKLDPFVKACLSDCFELYSDAIPDVTKALKEYKTKHYEDANIDVSSISTASTTCEDGFNEKNGVVSPLTKRNTYTFQLSAIALSIINMQSRLASGN